MEAIIIKYLQSITLAVTEKCNLKCIWCFQNSSPSTVVQAKETALEDIKKIVDLVAPYTDRLTLTGGEPFTRSDIKDILDYCIKQTKLNISITTNSLLISNSMMNYLACNNINVIVSIDGVEEKHDIIRGNGTYNRTIEKIRQMKVAGVNVAIQMTVSKNNIDDLEKVIAVAEELNVQLAIQRMLPFGRGADVRDLYLSSDDIRRVYDIIKNSAYKSIHSKEVLHRPGACQVIKLMESYPNSIVGGCKVGMGYVYIDSCGKVYGCPFLPYNIGDVFSEKTIIEIVESADLIKKIRTREMYTGKCRECVWWNACRGCRAAANSEGDVMGDDPLCWYKA